MSWIAVGIGVAGLAVGGGMMTMANAADKAAGAAGEGRDYGDEGRETFADIVNLAPEIYAAEASQQYGQPAYARINRNILYENLFGEAPPPQTTRREGGTTSYSLNQGAVDSYRQSMEQPYGGYGNYYGYNPANTAELDTLASSLTPEQYAALSPDQKRFYNQTVTGGTMVTEGGAPGVIDMFKQAQPGLSEIEASYTRATREADLKDVQELAPGYREAFRQANPELFAGIDRISEQMGQTGKTEIEQELERQALEELKLGRELTPEQLALADEGIRSAMMDRGRAYGTPAITAEVLNRYGLAEQRVADRRAFAGTANTALRQGMEADRNFLIRGTGTVAGATVDPSLAVLGRQSTGQGYQQMAASAVGGGGMQLYNPWNNYAADLYNTNYNAQVSSRLTSSQMEADLGAGLIDFGGSLMGGLIGFGG